MELKFFSRLIGILLDDTANFLSSNNVAIEQKALNNCSLLLVKENQVNKPN